MAKHKGRGRMRPFSSLRRRSSVLFMGPRGIARKGRSINRKNSRSKKAADQTLKIRDIPKNGNEPYEYVVYLFTKLDSKNRKHIEEGHKAVVDFVKSCISEYKIYKTKINTYPESIGINCIKLASESDLMMLMLCHREHVRKIFRLVDEPK